MIFKQRAFLDVWCNFIISMYSPYEKDMRWWFGTNKIVLISPYNFFFFRLQQHFIAEDYLLVHMRDNYYIKVLYFTLELVNYLQIILYNFFSIHNLW